MKRLLEIRNLNLFYASFHALKDINLSIQNNEILGIAGESGSGKSSLINSIIDLLPYPKAKLDGTILYKGKNIQKLSLNKIRGKEISLITQANANSLNPVIKIGKQLTESILVHNKLTKKEAKLRAEKILEKLGINKSRYMAYPHELSGGMKQRVIIACAIANNPKLLLADEPTTALDPIVEQSVIRILYKLKEELQHSIIFVSHDIHLLATISDRLAIMLNGEIIELGTTGEIYNKPKHPYTKKLINSLTGTIFQ